MDGLDAPAAKLRPDGVVYTPAPVVRHILRHTLDDFLLERAVREERPLRIVDPGCGDGAFLVEAYRRLLVLEAAQRELSPEQRLAVLRQRLFGVDIDSAAVERARTRLAALVLDWEEDDRVSPDRQAELNRVTEALAYNVVCGDAIARPSRVPFLEPGAFQAIVANPPFVGARRMALQSGQTLRKHLQQGYCVQGSCDLYVIFLERICELLAEGGKFGIVAPNRIAQAEYARPCRELLLAQTRLARIDDLSGLGIFPSVAVYPWILCGAKSPAKAGHEIAVTRPTSLEDLERTPVWHVRQDRLDVKQGFSLQLDFDLELRVPTRPLSAVATLHSGTTGFAAQRMADALVERDDFDGEAWDFITTGNIDRYRIRVGEVRFMRRDYPRPVLPCNASLLSERKQRLYREPKIVLAGMCRQPEAAWSEGGLALGVQVYAAAAFREDPFFLLAILNSKLMNYLFGSRFHGRRMAGGYIAVNKSQLSTLPIREIEKGDARGGRLRDELAEAARRLTQLYALDRKEGRVEELQALTANIDEAVLELYAVSESEAAQIEAELPASHGRAPSLDMIDAVPFNR